MSRLNSPAEWVAPLTPIISLALLPLGPIFFPRAYVVFLFVYFTGFLYQQVNHVCKFYLSAQKIRANINKWNLKNQRNSDKSEMDKAKIANLQKIIRHDEEGGDLSFGEYHYLHTFVIPNYSEPEGLLKDTIGKLAMHRNARSNYVIILAMEASEEGWEAKGQRIQEFFKDRFHGFFVTGHPTNVPGEYRGKGSNVNYAVRHGCEAMLGQGYDRSRIMLTIMDADAAIPELYIHEVEEALNKSDDPYYTICAPPIFFSRNSHEVPAAVRMTDITWATLVMSNLSNSDGLCVPCSNYSLSFILADRVGYWDVDADAIGEDMHMWLKCFFKTDGHARTASIYVPINLTNVQCDGYMANLHARYVQAKRHFQGVADLGYTLRHTLDSFKNRKKVLDCPTSGFYHKLAACSVILEAHMIPASSGWLMFAAVPLMQLILFPPFTWMALVSPISNPLLTSDFFSKLWTLVKLVTVFLPFPLFANLAIYEHLHRFVDREFYNKPLAESRSWKNILDYTCLPLAAWLFLTLPSTIACVKRLIAGEEAYIVGAKIFKEEDLSQDVLPL
ncbi:glycosyl transferase family group 2-domain-containing protein [Sporodiniella umbellata]|nr:glycosyl transferase family group 2-domain-containing protein [Sporodiniella umbellata]